MYTATCTQLHVHVSQCLRCIMAQLVSSNQNVVTLIKKALAAPTFWPLKSGRRTVQDSSPYYSGHLTIRDTLLFRTLASVSRAFELDSRTCTYLPFSEIEKDHLAVCEYQAEWMLINKHNIMPTGECQNTGQLCD